MRICIFVILSFININNVLAFGYSQTLPVMFIQTEDNKPILTKTEYINATYYIDPMGIEGIDPIGSVANPLPFKSVVGVTSLGDILIKSHIALN